MPYNSTASIQSVVFHADGAFDITYAEEADIYPKGITLHQHSVPAGVVNTSEILDDLKELLDLALAARFEDPDEKVFVRRK